MAKIKTREIRFTPSISPNIVTNKLYIEENGTALTYDSPSFDVGNIPDVNTNKVHIDLKTYLADKAGFYDIGIAAVDDVGNEADMRIILAVSLDFIAPIGVSSLELL